MKKCLLLFLFLLVSIAVLKISEEAHLDEVNKTTVEQLVDDVEDNRIAKN